MDDTRNSARHDGDMQRTERWPVVVAAVLTFGAGALDVLALTRLGGVFASVMTGNLALLGLGLAHLDRTAIIHTAVAVTSYAIGVAVGSRITGARGTDHSSWPRRVTAVLAVQLIVQCALATGWFGAQGNPVGGAQVALLAAAAASMGLQGAAMRGLGVTLATTYLTGTLTGLVAKSAAATSNRGDATGLAAVIAAVVGAACGALLLTAAPTVAPVAVLIPVAVIVASAEWRHRSAAHLVSQ